MLFFTSIIVQRNDSSVYVEVNIQVRLVSSLTNVKSSENKGCLNGPFFNFSRPSPGQVILI